MFRGIKGFLGDLGAMLRKYWKGLLILVGSGTCLALVFLGVLAHQSDKPEFCRTCHIMESYYQSWKRSSHNKVGCLLCHFKPGLQGYVRSKLVALSQFLRYVTVIYGSKPWAEIEDASCLRSGCHEGKMLAGPMEFRKGVVFDHKDHLATLKRGKQLRCTSCHSQIVQGSHMLVTKSVCFICHFKPQPDGTRDPVLSDCLKCHRKGIKNPRTPVEHALFIDRGTDCTKCHVAVTRGDGAVPHQRCEACHADEEHLKVTEPERLHKIHVTDHKVECFLCHETIVHRLETAKEITQADCGICHLERHRLQKAFYQGAANVPFSLALPSPMIEAHIDCTACHAELDHKKGETPVTVEWVVARASGKVCVECHGPGYDRLLGDWQREIARRVSQTRTLARVESSLAPSNGSTTGTTLAEKANQTLEIIGAAKAVHNIGYTATLIEHSQAALLDATSRTAEAQTLRDWVGEELPSFQQAPSCLQKCHYGISQATIALKNQNRDFPHAPHVNRANLDCGACHSRDQHKVSLPRGYDCNGCHHREAQQKQCVDCHKQVFAFAQGNYAGFNLPNEPALKCDSCHADTGGKITMLNRDTCTQCHADSKGYLAKLGQQANECKRLGAEVNSGLRAQLDTLDLKGLEVANQVRMVERVNGIHNYALAQKIYAAAKAYLTKNK